MQRASGDLLLTLQAGVQPDTAIYTSIMKQQAAASMGPGALEDTLADMEAHGLQPDRRSLFTLLRVYSREGDLRGTASVMRRMAQLGRGPSCFLPCMHTDEFILDSVCQKIWHLSKAMTVVQLLCMGLESSAQCLMSSIWIL